MSLYSRLLIIIIFSPFVIINATLDTLKLDFSHPHGFYEDIFELTISSSTGIDSIAYTLDCSEPGSTENIQLVELPFQINIDPNSDKAPFISPSVIIRIVGIQNGLPSTYSISKSFVFINELTALSQDGKSPGEGWPSPKNNGSGQLIDYGLDSQILKDSRYTGKLRDAILQIPSFSIVTDLTNLFDPSTGIYVNAQEDGYEWERASSIELLNANDGGFQVNAGLRIRGAYSRRDQNPKHSFRFLFKSEYGAKKLKYPLFGKEGEKSFDNIDLRTNQNYSWNASGDSQASKNTMVREVFSRDSQKEMNQPYTRSRQVHLFLNGVYWGLYMTQERSEASYAKSYLGGLKEDYDIVKTNKEDDNKMFATDGNLDAWKRLWTFAMNGFSNDEDYFKMQGFDLNGEINPEYERLADIDNLITYMLITFYTGNFDAPVGWWWNNQKPNNAWTIFNRVNPDGFKFLEHDCEHIFVDDQSTGYRGLGLYLDRTGPFPQLGEWYWFNAQEFHQALVENEEYLIKFSDFVYKTYFNNGKLTPSKSIERFLSRANEIDQAIIAESARWGDANSSKPRTKDDDWQVAIDNLVNDYFPNRTGIVVDQIKDNNWYPEFDPPIFKINNSELLEDYQDLLAETLVNVENNNSVDGEIVLTTNGEDPRNIGGSINSSAIVSDQDISFTIDSTLSIKARLKVGEKWSALHEVKFSLYEPTSDLIISEIHYHPLDADTVNDGEYEFLEIKNIGTTNVDLSKAYFGRGIVYQFPENALILPSEIIVLASNASKFEERYGFESFGEFDGQLDNGGETLQFINSSGVLIEVKYDDDSPWPTSPDGLGYSLTNLHNNEISDPNNSNNWGSSNDIHGTPGVDEVISNIEDEDGMINDYHLSQNYPNPFNPSTIINYSIPHKYENRNEITQLKIYDILGKEIETLVNEIQNPGHYTVIFNADKLSSGIYFYTIKSGNYSQAKKMILLK